MPYALISDIHGDARALDIVLAELARLGIDDGIVLGDVAQGGDQPAEVLDRLAEVGWPVVLGNADAWLLDESVEVTEPAAVAKRGWTLEQLDTRHLEQIGGFPMTVERDGLLAFHGSPGDFDAILFPDTVDLTPWEGTGSRLLAGGHTHFQWTRRVGDAVYVNPGSVGLPVYRWDDRRPLPHSEFAIVHGEGVEFRSVAWDS